MTAPTTSFDDSAAAGSDVDVTDLFAGAGGSSTGAVQIPGVRIDMAANHWPTAIAVHQANHPHTDHACVDLHLEDPRFFRRTRVLWASPECTKWSQANSNPRPAIEEGLFEDPLSSDAAQRSRLLMFDVLRFVDHHRYDLVIVENVVDVATQAKYRLAWYEWRRQLRALGYRFRVVSLNSMHAQAFGAPAPQSRDRIYIVCWPETAAAPDVERILRPKAWCPRCAQVVESRQSWKAGREVGRYKQAYVYVHGDCGTQVEPAWLPAAAAIDWSIPGERIGTRLSEKTRLRIAAGIARYWGPIHLEATGNQYDAADPNHAQHARPDAYYRAWPMDEPIKTLNTQETKALAVPVEGRDGKDAWPLDIPLRTQTTRLETALAQPPLVATLRGTDDVHLHGTTRPADEPMATVAANGNHHALITRHYGIKGGNPARHTTPVDEQLRTLTGNAGNMSLVVPSGGTWNEDARPTQDPLFTMTTRDSYGVAHEPLVAPYYGTADHARPVSNALGTLTTVDRYALVHRHNSGGAEMTTPVFEELRTLTGGGNVSLLRPGRTHVTAADLSTAMEMLPEVLFRMFRPHEVAAGMAFPGDYDWEVRVDGRLPSHRDLVKMAGNAVTPPASRDLLGMAVEYLTGRTVELEPWQAWGVAA